jgi:hypothetical protein
VISDKKEGIDLTLGTNHVGSLLVRHWHVPGEHTLSDDR